jgi:Tfp pilus assembly protein PilE
MSNLKKSFTLIEMMISVIIIFIVVDVMLEITSNIKHLFEITKSRKEFELKASIASIEEKNSKNLYEKLIGFEIKNDSIIKTLKKEKLSTKKMIEFSTNENINNNKIHITLYKTKIYNKYNLDIYGLEIE